MGMVLKQWDLFVAAWHRLPGGVGGKIGGQQQSYPGSVCAMMGSSPWKPLASPRIKAELCLLIPKLGFNTNEIITTS